MQTRTDVHRPSYIRPEDYSYTTSFDTTPPEIWPPDGVVTPEFQRMMELVMQPWREERDRLANMLNTDTSVYKSLYRCDHCGAHLRYVSLFYHEPTGNHIAVGEECAENTMDVPDRMTLEIKRLRERSAARREKARMDAETRKAKEETRKHDPVAAGILDNYEGENSFILDVKARYDKWGNISDAQASAIINTYNRENKVEEEEELSSVVEGKILVTGTVKRVYFKENAYGGRLVMIVRDDRNFNVWGSVPSSIANINFDNGKVCGQRQLDEGDRVSFTATVTKSDRDETFGFFKRPTKAQVLGE